MLKVEDIEAAGFKEFPVDKFSKLRFVDRNWQKTFYNSSNQKTLYFITIQQWDYTTYPHSLRPYGYQGLGHFTRGDNEVFKVDLLYPESVEQLEAFFYDMFFLMRCKVVDS